MPRELKQLKKNFPQLPKSEIFQAIRIIRNSIDLKNDEKETAEFAETLFLLLGHFNETDDYNSERIILNQLVEVAWWAQDELIIIDFLAQGISKVLLDSYSTRGEDRTNLFSDFVDIIARFPENRKIYSAISTAAIELIKWGTDKEIIKILEIMNQKSAVFPLVESIQILDAKVFMSILFYLEEQNCKTIKFIYNQFSSFAISNFEEEQNGDTVRISTVLLGEEINEILQEGAINAIINMARVNSKNECEECLLGIRRVIQDSEYLLRKDGKEFFRDIYRLSYTLDQYKLWEHFLDLQLIKDLKLERDNDEKYHMAVKKLFTIQKTMRIEEYDSLKSGRRGLKLAYDLEDLNDLELIITEIAKQKSHELQPVSLVAEIDAVIDDDEQLKEHLREIGEIPQDRQSLDEIQDQITKSDDVTVPATKENKIEEQIEFLRQLEMKNNRYLMNQMVHAKGLILAVGMFGFYSPTLNITPEEILSHFESICEQMMIIELIEPLVRAVTLRAARFDHHAANILLELLNSKGHKFLTKHYKLYSFVDNLVRLISYLGRTGKKEVLIKIKSELEEANRISLNDETIPLKIARAINEAILSYSAEDELQKIELLELVRELAKRHSYNSDLQVKYVEGLNFLILDSGFSDIKLTVKLVDELIDFARSYRNNQQIEEKAALGILWGLALSKINNQTSKLDSFKKEIDFIASNYPESSYLRKIQVFLTIILSAFS
ncbi:MAG: hypothetical protein GPJ52_07000 [Candidatus Heimdallarchaeota archaeon]|nr:hypothetical protein [Candidatus Heimdallarchaeota archaeon]